MPSLRDRLESDLKLAMRDRDRDRISVLRTTLAALSNAEAVDASTSRPGMGAFASEVERRVLTHDESVAIVRRERDELLASVGEYEAGGQHDAAAGLRSKASVLAGYLDSADEAAS